MASRHCDVCNNWHDLDESWPSQCMGHYHKRAQKHGDGPTYMPDIQPFKSPIDGHVVNSRKEYSQHLKLNGAIEVGNEKMPEKKYVEEPGIVNDIRRAMHETGYHRD